jgi:eukaryotic-like serine/threonine-protein kinase
MAAVDPSLDQSLVGAVLSRRYRLIQELGRGGMGAVYAAQPVEGGGTLAIKILHGHFIGDEAVLRRFIEEGRTCMRLVHPNILHVHECATAEDGSPYLVMDLLEGVPLSAYTRNGGRVSMAHAIPILHGMLAGLEAAHTQGVVHRDLKPGNVYLAREPDGLFTVKLLDFGIAKVMDVAGGMGNKTKTGMLLGTPAYMSPEQIKSAKDVDSRADLWSAGVMFYEMLTGRTAFPAPTEYARLSAVLQSEPEPLAAIDPELACLSTFMARALQKDPAARYQTARDMSLALQAAATEGRRSASPGEPSSRVVATPLSRLPDRAWLDGGGASQVGAPGSHRIVPPEPPGPAGAPPSAVDEQAVTHFESAAPKSSTLASAGLAPTPPSAKGEARPAVPPTSVSMVAVPDRPPSISAPPIENPKRRGVRAWIVVFLVILSLAVGLVGGYVLDHYYSFG